MCGICGKLNLDPDKPVEESLIRQMCAVIVHRGPDDEGVYIDKNVGLGNRRLAIIDLSPAGHQPMSNEDGTIWITLNGEIYNYPRLRPQLERKGHRFFSNSDTEAILHLYEDYGDDCVQHLRGMFAFALWDKRKRRLLLARDRVGQKPLFYTEHNGALFFASEIKAILQVPGVPRQVDLNALHDYLTYQYVPPPATMFKGIYKLPPAYILTCENGQMNISRYWEFAFEPKAAISEEEAVVRIEELLEEAVRVRLLSDVPLGVFLSGGIDSSLVVAIMSRLTDQPVRTFSIGFEEAAYNELPYARMVAQRYGTQHQEFIVRPNAVAVLPELIWHFDEPLADSSAVPTYYIAQMTAQHVKVALNGDGGDESFVGYTRYLGYNLTQFYQIIPELARARLIPAILDSLPLTQRSGSFLSRLRWLNEASLAPQSELYAQSMLVFKDDMKDRLYTPQLRKLFQGNRSLDYMMAYFNDGRLTQDVDRMLYSDIMTYLPGDLLVKMDRMAMAHSLESRSPFLDHKLMEFAATLPTDLKFRGHTLKYLLKKLAERFLPREVIYRPKHGFGVPVERWFYRELRPILEEAIYNSKLVADGYLDGPYMAAILEEHLQDGRRNRHGHRLWTLLNLEMWYRTFILGDGRRESVPHMEEFITPP